MFSTVSLSQIMLLHTPVPFCVLATGTGQALSTETVQEKVPVKNATEYFGMQNTVEIEQKRHSQCAKPNFCPFFLNSVSQTLHALKLFQLLAKFLTGSFNMSRLFELIVHFHS